MFTFNHQTRRIARSKCNHKLSLIIAKSQLTLCLLTALRKTMLRAHRQAWCWQDEYYGLTMDDIRRLERETQLALQQTMRDRDMVADGGSVETGGRDERRGSSTGNTNQSNTNTYQSSGEYTSISFCYKKLLITSSGQS